MLTTRTTGTIREAAGVRYQVLEDRNVPRERFVAFGPDRRHRAGGSAFLEAAQKQEEIVDLPTGQMKARTNVGPTP